MGVSAGCQKSACISRMRRCPPRCRGGGSCRPAPLPGTLQEESGRERPRSAPSNHGPTAVDTGVVHAPAAGPRSVRHRMCRGRRAWEARLVRVSCTLGVRLVQEIILQECARIPCQSRRLLIKDPRRRRDHPMVARRVGRRGQRGGACVTRTSSVRRPTACATKSSTPCPGEPRIACSGGSVTRSVRAA